MSNIRRLVLVTVRAVLLLGVIHLACGVTNSGLHVQGLFPLTGSQASRGYAELAGARMAIKVFKEPTDIQFAHNDSMCNAEVEAKVTIETIANEGSNVILLGGGCQTRISDNNIGNVLPQVLFESTYVTSSKLVINFRPTLTSLHQAIAALITRQGWNEVVIVHEDYHIYEKGSAILRDMLKSKSISTGLFIKITNPYAESILRGSTLRIIILYLSPSRARDFLCTVNDPDHRYRWLIPSVNITDISKACPEKSPTVVTLSLRQVIINQDFARNIEQIYDIHGEDIVSSAYSYDALSLILQSMTNASNDDVIELLKSNTYTGATGAVEFGPSGQRLFQTRINAYVGNDVYSYGSYYSSLSRYTEAVVRESLNVTDRVMVVTDMEGVGLVFFVIMTSLAAILIIYTIVIMGYVIKMRDERFYKMTSPNINIVILLSAVLGCLHVILTGLSGVKLSLSVIRNAHVAGRYLLCTAFSLFYGASLMKTWRVYVIFKNLNANGKLTRDIVLVAVVFIMVIVDVILVSIWSFADPLKCDLYNSSVKYEAATGIDRIRQIHVCWSNLQPLWIGLIYLYKAAILATCVYFAWQTRHVTLPSMQDAPYIYVVILNGAFIGVLLIPNLVLFPTGEKLSYGVTSLGLLYLISANISLLFIPKILTYRQIQKGLKKDDKLAFSESLKKTQEATEKTGCLNSCFGSAEKDKAAWQEVLGVEIENLKATVKQKDTTIRELNDRLYYGADKFQEYLTRRQPTGASSGTQKPSEENSERVARGVNHSSTPVTSNHRPNRSDIDAGQRVAQSEYNQRHSHAHSDSGQRFRDKQRPSHVSDAGQHFSNDRRLSHTYSDHGIDNGAFRSRSSSKASRISVQIHSNSEDSTSTGDDDSMIPTPRMVMAPPIEQRSNLQAMANVAYVRSIEDISHDSAIENPPDGSDRESEHIYHNNISPNNNPRTTYLPSRQNISVNRLPFPKNPEGTPGSDDSGIAAIYSPVGMSSMYSPMEYKNHRNNTPNRFVYDERMQADTIV